jgi:hypothetical protein
MKKGSPPTEPTPLAVKREARRLAQLRASAQGANPPKDAA